MAGEKFMRKCSRPRAWSKKQSVKSCEMKEGLDNVVIIDVDSDNVIFIDDPESIPQNLVSSSVSRKGKKIEFRGVISIDDDETNNVDSTAPDYVDKPENLDDDECRVVREEASAFKSSNRKQAYSRKNSCRNRYGLYGESESGSSDGNCSDCEVMEGSFGKLHEEWKKAFLKRKSNVCKGKSGLEDQACPSFMNVDTQTGAAGEVGKRNEQCSETAFCSNSSSVNYKTQTFSAFGPTENGHWGTASQNPGKESSFWEFHQNDNFSWPPDLTGSGGSFLKKDGLHFSRATNAEDPSSSSSWWQSYNYVNDGGGTVRMEKHSSQEPSPCSTQEHSAKHCDHIMKPCCTDKEKTVMGEQSNSQEFNRYFVHGKTSFGNEEASFGKSLKSCHAQVNNESFLPNGKGEEVYQATHSFNTSPSRSHHQSSKLEEEKPISGDSVVAANPQPSKETEVECGVSPSEFEVGHEGKDPFHAQGVIVAHSVQGDIINEREKLKETDEYKRAMEEEWASRQQQLRIQAEEVQRLRKKKRAESMRLLDMERRQKQRLEEIRETQKKDEENMNLKEQLRVEVRKELYKLETTCVDMASLLRGLGIHVGSSFNPLSHEVHAAYKRAVLRFHPDRASKTDIRQQVEAEEKFKLISRMKEKFLLTSCH